MKPPGLKFRLSRRKAGDATPHSRYYMQCYIDFNKLILVSKYITWSYVDSMEEMYWY